ncbi:hypothetical protein M9Y10_026464 [Tritrichomonas musculus]|uniref:C2 domain-containing protein n=1 Tax=Tritrichomonas musculus TaxID=1915356 RepID=A0ABR2H7U4_9EUKA
MSCRIHIKAIEAKDVLRMDTLGNSDPFLRFQLKGKPESAVKTSVVYSTLNPVWNQELEIISEDYNSDILEVCMFDEDVKKDDQMMNEIEIPLRDHKIGDHFVFNDKIKLRKKVAGNLHFELDFLSVSETETH